MFCFLDGQSATGRSASVVRGRLRGLHGERLGRQRRDGDLSNARHGVDKNLPVEEIENRQVPAFEKGKRLHGFARLKRRTEHCRRGSQSPVQMHTAFQQSGYIAILRLNSLLDYLQLCRQQVDRGGNKKYAIRSGMPTRPKTISPKKLILMSSSPSGANRESVSF